MKSSAEHLLEGGNVAEAGCRVGSTVRKPATVSTAAVEALLDHFAEVGFSGAPRSLGRDELGRHVLEYVPGRRPTLFCRSQRANCAGSVPLSESSMMPPRASSHRRRRNGKW